MERRWGEAMMDVHEAIKGLDGYAETVTSLSALLGANWFEKKSGQHEALLVQIKEKQADARSMVLMIMKEIHDVGTKADRSGDLTGIGAAIQRYLVADDQANEALKKAENVKKPNEVAEAVRRFRLSAGLITE
jgi:hypothetical protein